MEIKSHSNINLFPIYLGIGALSLFLLVVFIMFFSIKLLWAWTIPDLFPGAVQQGLIASKISWFTSFKLALFFGILTSALSRKKK